MPDAFDFLLDHCEDSGDIDSMNRCLCEQDSSWCDHDVGRSAVLDDWASCRRSDEFGSTRQCLCAKGHDAWCDPQSAMWSHDDGMSVMSTIWIVGIVLMMLSFLSCLCFCCRRRRQGFVFYPPPGRATGGTVQYPGVNTSQQGGPPTHHQQQHSGYPQQHGGYPQQAGGYPQQAGGYSQPQSGYMQLPSGYTQHAPPPSGGYPQQHSPYPPQQSAPGADDLPPPYETVTRQSPYNPNFSDSPPPK